MMKMDDQEHTPSSRQLHAKARRAINKFLDDLLMKPSSDWTDRESTALARFLVQLNRADDQEEVDTSGVGDAEVWQVVEAIKKKNNS